MAALLYGPPIVFAIAMAYARSGEKRQWITGLVVLAVAQLAAVALFAPDAEFSATFGLILLVSVVLPWVLAGSLVAISKFPRNAVFVAVGVPVLYFITWAVGAFIGLSTGVLPK